MTHEKFSRAKFFPTNWPTHFIERRVCLCVCGCVCGMVSSPSDGECLTPRTPRYYGNPDSTAPSTSQYITTHVTKNNTESR
jgi:hypothetical protein